MGENMKYKDLIQFEQIGTVIQLFDIDRSNEAKKLVASYDISVDMAERICKLDALELLDDVLNAPVNSRYAKELLEGIKAKAHGQVLYRNELRFVVK